MKRLFLLTATIFISSQFILAQKYQHNDEPQTYRNGDESDGGDFKGNFFTGGSISLSFFDGSFLAGGNPVLGYSLTKWADVGIVGNYTYASYRDYQVYNDKLRQTVYGGGVFTRLFPVKFLFAQAQLEHNWIKWKYIAVPGSGYNDEVQNFSANSLLVGGGYTTGRNPNSKSMYGYLAILFDVANDINSPYKNGSRTVPIIRAGINVPLFQGRGKR